MSSYERYDTRRRRPLYAPPSTPRRSTLSSWLPLALTVTLATAGLAAWIWSERQDSGNDDNDDNDNEDNANRDNTPAHPAPRSGSEQHGHVVGSEVDAPPPSYPGPVSRTMTGEDQDEGFFARVSGAMRRTPSPQQLLDSAGQRIAAGLANAVGLTGAAATAAAAAEAPNAAASHEQERDAGFSDHEHWNEEAESRRVQEQAMHARDTGSSSSSSSNRPRKTVAVVLSALDSLADMHHDDEAEYRREHASILSHLPHSLNPSTTRLFVLIYAPHLTSLPPIASDQRAPPSTLSSSYSAISTPAQTPGEELGSISPTMLAQSSDSWRGRLFDELYSQALALVDKPSMILPFTTPTGYLHIVRHLAPSLLYLSDDSTMSGHRGATVAQLKGWVGQIVVVVGDDAHGGLVDTETEDEAPHPASEAKWWQDGSLVGLGKGIDVVDAARVGDDWDRRLNSRQ